MRIIHNMTGANGIGDDVDVLSLGHNHSLTTFRFRQVIGICPGLTKVNRLLIEGVVEIIKRRLGILWCALIHQMNGVSFYCHLRMIVSTIVSHCTVWLLAGLDNGSNLGGDEVTAIVCGDQNFTFLQTITNRCAIAQCRKAAVAHFQVEEINVDLIN